MRYRARVEAMGACSPIVTGTHKQQAERKGDRAYTTPMIYTHCRAQAPIDRADEIGADNDAMMTSMWY